MLAKGPAFCMFDSCTRLQRCKNTYTAAESTVTRILLGIPDATNSDSDI